MTPRFLEKQALVTGAASGIGRAVALALAAEGARVHAVDRDETGLASLVCTENLTISPCDLADRSAWRRTLRALPPPEILVNSAAVSLPSSPCMRDDPAWEQTFAVNFDALVEACKDAVERMPENGRIINLSSIQGRLYERGNLAYGVAKAAVEQLTRGMAVELAPRKILVNAVAPGFVNTAMSRASGINELETEWFQERYIAQGRIPLRRPAQPEEIACVVLFLASPENTYLTGQIITVDGGLSLTL